VLATDATAVSSETESITAEARVASLGLLSVDDGTDEEDVSGSRRGTVHRASIPRVVPFGPGHSRTPRSLTCRFVPIPDHLGHPRAVSASRGCLWSPEVFREVSAAVGPLVSYSFAYTEEVFGRERRGDRGDRW
jgi:hypothetical protein